MKVFFHWLDQILQLRNLRLVSFLNFFNLLVSSLLSTIQLAFQISVGSFKSWELMLEVVYLFFIPFKNLAQISQSLLQFLRSLCSNSESAIKWGELANVVELIPENFVLSLSNSFIITCAYLLLLLGQDHELLLQIGDGHSQVIILLTIMAILIHKGVYRLFSLLPLGVILSRIGFFQLGFTVNSQSSFILFFHLRILMFFHVDLISKIFILTL